MCYSCYSPIKTHIHTHTLDFCKSLVNFHHFRKVDLTFFASVIITFMAESSVVLTLPFLITLCNFSHHYLALLSAGMTFVC